MEVFSRGYSWVIGIVRANKQSGKVHISLLYGVRHGRVNGSQYYDHSWKITHHENVVLTTFIA
jgi:hypothetical protein